MSETNSLPADTPEVKAEHAEGGLKADRYFRPLTDAERAQSERPVRSFGRGRPGQYRDRLRHGAGDRRHGR